MPGIWLSISCSPATERIPRTSASTLSPALYSLAPKKVETKQIKEGVAEVFEANPDLVLIGTAQDYSDYLDTIFPESKVKDIVYHGSKSKIEQFEIRKEWN